MATAKPESCSVCHGSAGAQHQAIYDMYTDAPTLVATINSVVSTPKGTDPETYDVLATFTLTKNGALYGDATLSTMSQKRYTATKYDPATKDFDTASAITFGTLTQVGDGQYTVKAAGAKFAPESAGTNAFVYFYFGEGPTLIPAAGHYNLFDNVASVAKVYGTVDYASSANVSACEKCHGAPYMKHGYRAAKVAGLPDFVACKACHTDQRVGTDFDWQVLADDPATLASLTLSGTVAADWKVDPGLAVSQKYLYTANVMNDTHMSHAMEFAYPQSMANCVTCHEGKLGSILTAANFTLTTCKSCHPVTAADGTDAKRAPALTSVIPAGHFDLGDLYNYTGMACNTCHSDGNALIKFSAIHTGYDKVIYADTAGTRYSEAFTAAITNASIAGNVLSFSVTVTENTDVAGVSVADLAPLFYVAPYGYDTKDFVVGAVNQDTAAAIKTGWTVTPSETTTTKTWAVTVDLATAATTWATRLAACPAPPEVQPAGCGSIRRLELGVRPKLTRTFAGDTTATTLATDMVTKTFDLGGNAFADFYAPIVNPAKCNTCHDALATTFHSPDRGGSVVGCRLCHVSLSGGSHLEMQSRSIDSYIHAIHSMQVFDLGDISNNVPVWDFTNPVEAMEYNHHVESTYPNFTLLNCESCHNEKTYEVPSNAKSLPGLLSKADTANGWDRNIGAVPAYVTGPASRACGSCHRAELINEDDANGLASFNEHTGMFGYMLDATTNASGVLDAAITKIMAVFQ